MSKKPGQSKPMPLAAMLLAWLIPGAGHAYLGRRGRGIIIFVTISATFWAGAAMGGVMTVDYENQRWWFVAEMLTGVNGLIGWHNQRRACKRLMDDPEIREQQLAAHGVALVAPTGTAARAYAGIAGLLNLMCIFDAVVLAIMGVRGEQASKRPQGERRTDQ